jgi:hypothetical protein
MESIPLVEQYDSSDLNDNYLFRFQNNNRRFDNNNNNTGQRKTSKTITLLFNMIFNKIKNREVATNNLEFDNFLNTNNTDTDQDSATIPTTTTTTLNNNNNNASLPTQSLLNKNSNYENRKNKLNKRINYK